MQLTDLIPNIYELIPYDYATIQTREYEELINKFLKAAPQSDKPLLIHMSGIPGSGKTTFYKSRPWQPHVCVAFDDIMEQLPSYRQDLKTLGSAASFKKWEIPARIIGYELLRRAVEQHKNIFFDHGGANNSHILLLKNAKKYNYTTEMHHIFCPAELAIQRTQTREKVTHRHTPRALIEQRSQKISSLLDEYKKIVDTFYVYDNSSSHFTPIETDKLPLKRIA